MVIVKLKGGLGEQMFQYAAALGIRREGETLYADLHALFGKDAARADGYALRAFPALRFPKVPNLVHRIFNRTDFPWALVRGVLRSRFRRATQAGSELNAALFRRRRGLYIEGQFLNPRYFEAGRAQLLSDFAFRQADEERSMLAGAIASRRDAVSIRVNKPGDDESPASAGPSPEYYSACIRRLRDSCEQPYFYVFTNDIHWAREQLRIDETEATFIVTETTDPAVMHLMAECAHHITGGNAEDWWGAWLSQRKGLNFIPSEWYGSGHDRVRIAEVAPEAWTVMPAR